MELVHLYSNLLDWQKRLGKVMTAASAQRSMDSAAHPRQYQHRLSKREVVELIAAFRHQHESVKHLAQQFKIHRTTVAALLRRQ